MATKDLVKEYDNITPQMGTTDVKKVQQKLIDGGYNPGKIDGWYGPKTISAVKEFQKNNNLKVDGIVGPKTLSIINKPYSTNTSSNPSNKLYDDYHYSETSYNTAKQKYDEEDKKRTNWFGIKDSQTSTMQIMSVEMASQLSKMNKIRSNSKFNMDEYKKYIKSKK